MTYRTRMLCGVMALCPVLSAVPARAEEPWRMVHKQDLMTGTETLSATRQFAAIGGGNFQVTASCATGMVNLAFEAPGRSRLEWQESESYSGTTFGFSTQLNRQVKRWVVLRVRLGQQPVKAVSSSSKYDNEAEIVFYDPTEVKRQADLHNPRAQGPRPPNGDTQAAVGAAIEGFGYGLLPFILPNIAAGTTAQLVQATELKVELPMADGAARIVTIDPSAPTLRDFLSHCEGVPVSAGATALNSPGRSGLNARGIEGSYANHQQTFMSLASGRAILKHGDQTATLSYTCSGSKLTLVGPGGETHQMDVLPDWTLQVPGHPEIEPLRRLP